MLCGLLFGSDGYFVGLAWSSCALMFFIVSILSRPAHTSGRLGISQGWIVWTEAAQWPVDFKPTSCQIGETPGASDGHLVGCVLHA